MTTVRRPLLRRAALTAASVALLAGLVACGSDSGSTATTEPALSGYETNPPLQVGDLSLPDASDNGVDFPFKARPGHLLIAYFGYTHCPDVCPTTLYEVKKAFAELGDQAGKVDLAMTTIDPARDTADIITGYVQSFVPTAHALRTDDQALLTKAAAGFGASYSVTTNAKGEIEVSHTPNMYLVDGDGTVILTWLFGVKADALASDLRVMLARSAS